MTSNEMDEYAERYVALWNELDAQTRRSSAQRLYASNGRLATASSERDGLDEVIAHIDKVVRELIGPDKHWFRPSGTVGHHDLVLLRWEMITARTGSIADWGINALVVDGDQRIVCDTQFVAPRWGS